MVEQDFPKPLADRHTTLFGKYPGSPILHRLESTARGICSFQGGERQTVQDGSGFPVTKPALEGWCIGLLLAGLRDAEHRVRTIGRARRYLVILNRVRNLMLIGIGPERLNERFPRLDGILQIAVGNIGCPLGRQCQHAQKRFALTRPRLSSRINIDSGMGDIDGYGSNKGAMDSEKQKSHSGEWLMCLILLVPPNGIEPLPDDYKSTARPSCYGGPGRRGAIIA